MLKYFQRPFFKSLSIFLSTIVVIKLIGWTSFPDKIFSGMNLFFSMHLYNISKHFSFSLGDIFYTLLAVLGLLFILRIIYLLIGKRFTDFKRNLSGLFYFLTVFYLIFYIIWGFNYYKIPLKDKFDSELNSLDELKQLAEMYYSRAAKYRAKVNENEQGAFVASTKESAFNSEIIKAAEILSKYPEIKFSGYRVVNLKPSTYSKLATHLGISGYYNPFTNESQYNVIEPDTRKVFAKLHEIAHQLGFADESEASMVGFLIGINSNDNDLLYACNFKAMRSILNRILWHDPSYVKGFVENKYTDGMKMDRAFEIEFDKKFNGSSDDLFALMNEAFLKLNNQEGLKSYGRFVELLVGFNRKYKSLE